MSWGIKKTEAGNRNGKGRWVTRAEAKTGSGKVRRAASRDIVKAAIAAAYGARHGN